MLRVAAWLFLLFNFRITRNYWKLLGFNVHFVASQFSSGAEFVHFSSGILEIGPIFTYIRTFCDENLVTFDINFFLVVAYIIGKFRIWKITQRFECIYNHFWRLLAFPGLLEYLTQPWWGSWAFAILVNAYFYELFAPRWNFMDTTTITIGNNKCRWISCVWWTAQFRESKSK